MSHRGDLPRLELPNGAPGSEPRGFRTPPSRLLSWLRLNYTGFRSEKQDMQTGLAKHFPYPEVITCSAAAIFGGTILVTALGPERQGQAFIRPPQPLNRCLVARRRPE